MSSKKNIVQELPCSAPTHLRPKFFHPLTLDVQFQTSALPPLSKLYRAFKTTESKQNQNQVTSQLNLPRALLFDLAHKQCNGIIIRWFHYLMLESKGRFFVNNILMFGSP